MLRTLTAIRDLEFQDLKPSEINISTISATARMNADGMKLRYIIKHFKDEVVQEMIQELIEGHYGSVMLDDTKSFSNSVILKLNKLEGSKGKNVAIKIFSNGMLHITGPVSASGVLEVTQFTCAIMDAIYRKKLGTYKTHDFYIQMMNTNFSVNSQLNKRKVHAAMRQRDMEATIPDTHPAVRLKVPVEGRKGKNITDRVTVLVFATGPIIITGVKSPEELLLAYTSVTKVLDEAYDMVVFHEDDDDDVEADERDVDFTDFDDFNESDTSNIHKSSTESDTDDSPSPVKKTSVSKKTKAPMTPKAPKAPRDPKKVPSEPKVKKLTRKEEKKLEREQKKMEREMEREMEKEMKKADKEQKKLEREQKKQEAQQNKTSKKRGRNETEASVSMKKPRVEVDGDDDEC
ncbi:TATA-box-binding protein-like [Tetrabaena socialis]|uniref:TATA-box-binding protein-like n=1 Tax=Tetrabaena socialis TaxID=47790 RepID=A0A2J8AJ93_9CHLO|nr:TATA-box-binding protein-like [Tetrabaena socialis]|eukprot:PNH12596.1 TATA-box-binding protein-like [Tetrabaena socialis]